MNIQIIIEGLDALAMEIKKWKPETRKAYEKAIRELKNAQARSV